MVMHRILLPTFLLLVLCSYQQQTTADCGIKLSSSSSCPAMKKQLPTFLEPQDELNQLDELVRNKTLRDMIWTAIKYIFAQFFKSIFK
ncbi:uncharacterized protein Dmoj_GI26001 [Drosophila mojavensis]|uniref:Uncharacterized protein n=1 Tax=Drosophila mojavensis TaxID=7230 RepID=A0A0Q9XA55_DROMO|nr:uncharacterized protein Dmoj_GI26001 [Drosophila mojavensis]